MEKEIRRKIVERILSCYPNPKNRTVEDYSSFLDGSEKITIDSWIGDVFPAIVREVGESANYEKWRTAIFSD